MCKPLVRIVAAYSCWMLLAVLIAPSLCSASGSYGIDQGVSLAELLDGGFIVAGDKRFSDFDYNLAKGNLQPQDIMVTGIYDNVINGYGLLFSGDFVAGGLSSPLKYEAGLAFTVTALDPAFVISDVHLDGTINVRGTGDAQIVESFTGVNVPSLSIYEVRLNGELIASKTSDDILFPDALGVTGFRSMRVLKDINLEAGENYPFDKAEVTTFQQVFTQRPIIPEPSSFTLLLGVGASLACGMRRRLR